MSSHDIAEIPEDLDSLVFSLQTKANDALIAANKEWLGSTARAVLLAMSKAFTIAANDVIDWGAQNDI